MTKRAIITIIAIVLACLVVGTCFALYSTSASKIIYISVENVEVDLLINNSDNTSEQADFILGGFSPSAREQTKDVTLSRTASAAANGYNGLFSVSESGALEEYLDVTLNVVENGILGEDVTIEAFGAGKVF